MTTIEGGESDIRAAMDEAIRAENDGLLQGVSQTHMLVLSVASPKVPTLDLVDLPGLVKNGRPGEPDDIEQQTLSLLTTFATAHKDHAIFLAVIEASQSLRGDDIVKLVNTLGVARQVHP